MKWKVRTIGAVLVASIAPWVHAQDYPARSIRIIVGSPAGGGTDLIGRLIAKKLTEAWGQQVIVENRTGAAGNIGAEAMARAVPDGYTLGIVPAGHAIAPSLYPKLPFDAIKDFTPISLLASAHNVLVVAPSLPVASVKDLVALARRRPGEMTFASGGVGSITHLATEYFRNVAGINAIHVPYKGSSQAEIDLAGGQVFFMVDTMPSAWPNIQARRTRALATTGPTRSAALPSVPTVLESGLKYQSISWWGMVGPARLPQPVVSKLHAEITRAMASADVKELLSSQGADVTTGTPQQFIDWLRQETAHYAGVIRNANVRIDQ